MTTSIHIRYLQALVFVAVYIALGFLLRLETGPYLLLGIPLSLLFQLFIARQPIHKLWLRNGEKFYLNKWGWTITLCFLIFPTYKIITDIRQDNFTLIRLGINVAVFIGAFCVGYCYSGFTKQTWKDFFLCLGLAFVIRMTFYFLPYFAGNKVFQPDWIRGIKYLLTNIPIAFVVEEVVFRGMLDSYVQPPANKFGIWSALFVSVLWGLWHLPVSLDGQNPIWLITVSHLIISVWGVLLSFFWRKTGNLAVPAFSHVFSNAIRETLK